MVFNKKIVGNENLLNSLEQEIKKVKEVSLFLEKQN